MGLKNWGSGNYLSSTNMPLTALPFIISAWVKTGDSVIEKCVSTLAVNSSNGDRIGEMHVSPSGRGQAAAWANPTFAAAQTTAGLVGTGSWVHILACFNGTADRSVYVNGGNKATNATSVSAGTPAIFLIGNNNASTPEPFDSAGGIAEVSIWDQTGWSDGNRDSFASRMYNGGAAGAGGNALAANAQASQPWTGDLKGYWIDSANTTNDLSTNGKNLTVNGTLTAEGTHPTIEAAPAGGTPININLTPDRLDRRLVWP